MRATNTVAVTRLTMPADSRVTQGRTKCLTRIPICNQSSSLLDGEGDFWYPGEINKEGEDVNRLVIHRDKTFWYAGEMYHVQRLGPVGSGDDMYEVYRDSDLAVVGYFDRLYDIRDFVDEAGRMNWELVGGVS